MARHLASLTPTGNLTEALDDRFLWISAGVSSVKLGLSFCIRSFLPESAADDWFVVFERLFILALGMEPGTRTVPDAVQTPASSLDATGLG